MMSLTVATLLSPGSGMTLNESASLSVPENPGVIDTLLNIVPDNIIGAFAELNMLGIIFTALVFGIAPLKMGQSERQHALGERLYEVSEALNAVTLKVMSGVLHYVPIGVFAIVAETVSQQGVETLLSLGDMVVVLYITLGLHLLIYCGIMRLLGVKLRTFFRETRTPMATAFATQSSSGTLPLTVIAAHRLGISKSIYGFNLPKHGRGGYSYRYFGGVCRQRDWRAAGFYQYGADSADWHAGVGRHGVSAGGRDHYDCHGICPSWSAD